MNKIFITYSPTRATEDFKQDMLALRQLLGKKYAILDFLTGGTPQEAFAHDLGQIKNCDLFLTVCDQPSTGVGFEIATALDHHKPVLAMTRAGAKISATLLGINYPLFSLLKYESLNEIVDAVEKKLAGII